jgi:hypothetical protein
MHAASHLPLHVPMHIPVLIMAVPPLAVQVPVQLPMHVPWQFTLGAVPGVQVPVQSASHEPVHCAWTLAEPSHVAPAMHMPLQLPLRSPGEQAAVTIGGVQLPLALHWPSHIASTSALTLHWPPDIDSPHESDAPASPLRIAEIAIDAWLQASVSSASVEPPIDIGPFAVHVSVTIRSLSMLMHAVRTEVSIVVAMVWRSAPAWTNACTSPPSESMPTDPGNSLHPIAACSAF